jgi:hypothetical protein
MLYFKEKMFNKVELIVIFLMFIILNNRNGLIALHEGRHYIHRFAREKDDLILKAILGQDLQVLKLLIKLW